MRNLVLLSLVLFGCLCLIPSDIEANTPIVEDGYTLGVDGYWYRGDRSFTREKVFYTAWDTHGCCYKQYYYWKYTIYDKPKTLPLSYKDPEWRTKYVELLRDMKEANEFKAAMQALGLKFDYETYGSSYALNSIGTSGSTTYGYIQTARADLLGPAVDQNVIFQQASRLVEQAQKLSGQGMSDFSALVEKEGINRAKTSELIALRDLIIALQTNQATVKIANQEFRIEKDKEGQHKIAPVLPNPGPDQSQMTIMQNNCVSCHGSDKEKNKTNFDATKWSSLSPDEKTAIIVGRLLTSDQEKRMPKGKPALDKLVIMELLPSK